ncbi:MAG: FAD-dependent oxidoreductase [Magnetococcales bacterium]|nr:FAD-dependent oxidoreductase [Magnetococcales bacterium]
MKRVLIIGGMASGPKFAMALKRRRPDVEITIIEMSDYLSFGACVLPHLLSGVVADVEALNRTPLGEERNSTFFLKNGNIATQTKTEALWVDRLRRKVITRSLLSEDKVIDVGFFAGHASDFDVIQKMGFIKDNQLTEKFFDQVRRKGVDAEHDELTVSTGGDSSPYRRFIDFLFHRSILLAFSYDKLFLGTGSTATIPPLTCYDDTKIIDNVLVFKNAFLVRTMDDGRAISKRLKVDSPKMVTIVGGGLIGVEVAAAVRDFDENVAVQIIEMRPSILSDMIEADISIHAQNYLIRKRITLNTSTKITIVRGSDGFARTLETDRGELFSTDLLLICTGVRPNAQLATRIGLDIGVTGGIRVNERMETSDSDILAAGDCIENTHRVSGKPVVAPFGDLANIQARVAAANLCGQSMVFEGVIGTSIAEIGIEKDSFGGIIARYSVGATGLTEKEAMEAGFDVETVLLPSKDRIYSMPEAEMIYLKMIADKKNRRLLGVQGSGLGDINRRIASAAAWIYTGASIDQLSVLDLPYAPSYSPAIDPLIMGAWVLQNKIAGLFSGIKPQELFDKLKNREIFQLIDVREPIEFMNESIPGSMLIPLNEIENWLSDAPRNQEFVLVCLVGLRSYLAARKMLSMGFTNVRVMEGGLALWGGKIVGGDDSGQDCCMIRSYLIDNPSATQNLLDLAPRSPNLKNETVNIDVLNRRNDLRTNINHPLSLETEGKLVFQGVSRNISRKGIFLFLGYMPRGIQLGEAGNVSINTWCGTQFRFPCNVQHVSQDGVGLAVHDWDLFVNSLIRDMAIFNTGEKTFDDDHVKMWNILDNFFNTSLNHDSQKIWSTALLDCARKHFWIEEIMMKKNRYPGLDRHIEHHQHFIDQAEALHNTINESDVGNPDDPLSFHLVSKKKFVEFLKFWLVRHTNSMDQSMVTYFRYKGIRAVINSDDYDVENSKYGH